MIAFPERFRFGSYCIVATIALLCAVAIGFLHFRAQDRRLMSVLRQQQRDWPQIQYYTIANQEWLADGPHDGAIVFLGDSVTQVVGSASIFSRPSLCKSWDLSANYGPNAAAVSCRCNRAPSPLRSHSRRD